MSLNFTQLMNVFGKLEDVLDKNSSKILPKNKFVKLTKMVQLNFPKVHNLTGGTHPSVKYFPNKWNGYEYWMAYTPYPGTENENPVIVCSRDAYNWITPSGLTNPISPTPETGYNSDTELVFSGGKLYCYWRWYTDSSDGNILYRMESGDGSHWTNKTECIFDDYVDPLSPSIVVDRNGNWTLWTGASTGGKMHKYTSDDGISWGDKTECETDLDNFGWHWHPSIWVDGKYYYCLSAFGYTLPEQQHRLSTDLYFGWSKDGVEWTFESNPLIARGEQSLKRYRVYRSCAVRTGDHHKIFVSGLGKESEQIHILEAVLLDVE